MIMHILHADATLTLDSDYYTVLESDGTVAIRVTVVDSNLPDNFSSISFTTTALPGSAKGIQNYANKQLVLTSYFPSHYNNIL